MVSRNKVCSGGCWVGLSDPYGTALKQGGLRPGTHCSFFILRDVLALLPLGRLRDVNSGQHLVLGIWRVKTKRTLKAKTLGLRITMQ